MADDNVPVAISAAFPVPPPFYKSFTPDNLARLEQNHPESLTNAATGTLPLSTPIPDLSALPPDLLNLIPPAPPATSYRSLGTLHPAPPAVTPTTATAMTTASTPARLKELTHNLLLSFLNMIQILTTNPGKYPVVWDQLHVGFREVEELINEYRPHQARETLISMMEGQVERVKGECETVREAVGRTEELLSRLVSSEATADGEAVRNGNGNGKQSKGKPEVLEKEKRLWEVLEKEVGKIGKVMME